MFSVLMLNALHDIRLKMATPIMRLALPRGYWHNSNSSACNLTFDDGPFPETTPALLEILAQNDVKATFFFCGRNIERFPNLVEMTSREGHEIGNHTYNHFSLLKIGNRKFEQELDQTNQLINDITGSTAKLFRPPYAIIDPIKARIVAERKMLLVYWGAFAEDWNPIGAKEVTRRIMAQIRPSSLIVLHESKHLRNQCLDSTNLILEKAKSRGVSFDTIAS